MKTYTPITGEQAGTCAGAARAANKIMQLDGMAPIREGMTADFDSGDFAAHLARIIEDEITYAIDFALLARARQAIPGQGYNGLIPTEKIRKLIHTFPALCRKRPYIGTPFNADDFHRQLRGWSHGEHLLGLFILNVWNPDYAKERKWKFDLMEAMGVLSNDNIEPLIAWMRDPVWP